MFTLLRPLVFKKFSISTSSLNGVKYLATVGSQNVKLAEDQLTPNPEPVLVNPLDVPDYFGVHQLVSMRQLFDARVHFGHKKGSVNEYMLPYLYGSRLGVCVIDLNQTVELLREALNVTAHIAFRGGVILFISNFKETGQYVEKTAKECGEYAHCRPYSTRTFTSSASFFGKVMRLPDLCIFLSTFNNVFLDHVAVRDAAKMCIPTIAICDSNSDPRLVTYPIPGNDDTPSAVHLYCDLFKEAILKGKSAREKILAEAT